MPTPSAQEERRTGLDCDTAATRPPADEVPRARCERHDRAVTSVPVALPTRPPTTSRIWLTARYRCADDAALAGDRIRREVGGAGGHDDGPSPRLSGRMLVIECDRSQLASVVRLVRRTRGRVAAI